MKAKLITRRLCATALISSLAAAGAAAQQDSSWSCANCGVVESTEAVQHAEKSKGIAGTPVTPGMAIGGVLGGVLGHQIGHGAGNTAATVAGAAGGAFAGQAVEKQNQKTYRTYVMHVRMNDGSLRTVEQREHADCQRFARRHRRQDRAPAAAGAAAPWLTGAGRGS